MLSIRIGACYWKSQLPVSKVNSWFSGVPRSFFSIDFPRCLVSMHFIANAVEHEELCLWTEEGSVCDSSRSQIVDSSLGDRARVSRIPNVGLGFDNAASKM